MNSFPSQPIHSPAQKENPDASVTYLSVLSHMWQLDENDLDEEILLHRNPNDEIRFYILVANGNVEETERNCREGHFYNMDEGAGILSRDPVVNLKYHCVITIALVTRFCCEAGMEKEYAFRLSDFYIRQLDSISTEQGVIDLHDYAVIDFSKKCG